MIFFATLMITRRWRRRFPYVRLPFARVEVYDEMEIAPILQQGNQQQQQQQQDNPAFVADDAV